MRAPFVDLLALPCAGASATMYLRWRRLLPQWIRVVPVELPGRGARMGQPFVEDFGQLVAQLCEEHAEVLRGRYVLFGHSMGALLAYGIAQRQCALHAASPQALLVSASPAPGWRDPNRFAGKNDDQALLAELRKQGGTPQEVFGNQELLRLTLDALGADYRVCDSFRDVAGELLPGPIHAFAGRQDDIEPERIEAWRTRTTEAFSLDWFDGGHFFIRRHEEAVLTALVRVLVRQFSGREHAALAAA